ncbi:protein krueppel-like [Penaeus indicus]|uniref:protein krueppel-like n=1 Tax=Penaeus indicus TaxID=29960 RepID=UPI00300D9434
MQAKELRFSQELKQHEKIHTDEKGFVCLYCEKKFFEKLAMSRHMKRNTGRKQFKCTYCDKSFKAKCILRKHVRIHQETEENLIKGSIIVHEQLSSIIVPAQSGSMSIYQ